jgi:hypothetical protein
MPRNVLFLDERLFHLHRNWHSTQVLFLCVTHDPLLASNEKPPKSVDPPKVESKTNLLLHVTQLTDYHQPGKQPMLQGLFHVAPFRRLDIEKPKKTNADLQSMSGKLLATFEGGVVAEFRLQGPLPMSTCPNPSYFLV